MPTLMRAIPVLKSYTAPAGNAVVSSALGSCTASTTLVASAVPGPTALLFRSVDVSVTGAFATENLIPGDYFIAAVPLEDRRRGLDMEFLTSLAPQATRLTVSESATPTADLRIIGGRR